MLIPLGVAGMAVTVAAVLFATDGLSTIGPPEYKDELPATWPTSTGEALRPVPMPTGEMIAAMPFKTAPHVLCQVITGERWEQLLGGRTLLEASVVECHARTAVLDVRVSMEEKPGEPSGQGSQVVVAGRAAPTCGRYCRST